MYESNISSAVLVLDLSAAQPASMASEQKSEERVSHLKIKSPQRKEGLTSEVGVIDLSIAEPGVVQDLELLSVRLCDVGKIFLIVGVDLLRVGETFPVSEMIPVGCCKGELDAAPLALRYNGLHILQLLHVAALSRVADLADADNCLARDVLLLEEGSDIWSVLAEDLWIRTGDLFEAIETWEETAPKHVSAVLAITWGVKPALFL